MNSLTLRMTTMILRETIGDFFYFPLWWYSLGLVRAARGIRSSLKRREEALALRLWMTTIFKPMYGQHDWQSKIISFVFRVLILFFRLFLFVFWVIVHLMFFVLYFILPLFLLYAIAAVILS